MGRHNRPMLQAQLAARGVHQPRMGMGGTQATCPPFPRMPSEAAIKAAFAKYRVQGLVTDEELFDIVDDIYLDLFPSAPMPIPAAWQTSDTCRQWVDIWGEVLEAVLDKGIAYSEAFPPTKPGTPPLPRPVPLGRSPGVRRGRGRGQGRARLGRYRRTRQALGL